jgi:hypothetical protein
MSEISTKYVSDVKTGRGTGDPNDLLNWKEAGGQTLGPGVLKTIRNEGRAAVRCEGYDMKM